MGLFSFNKRPQHNSFDYKPRFYDPAKEDLQSRLDKFNDEKDTNYTKDRIRAGLRSKARGNSAFRKEEVRKSNIRLLLIIGTLVLASVYFMQSDAFKLMIESFLGE